MFVLTIVGIFRILNQDELTSELKLLRESNIFLQNILSDVEYRGIMDSLGSYEEFLSTYYSKHILGYPDIAPVEGYVTRGLNEEKKHFGIDIAAKYKDNIYRVVVDRKVQSKLNKFIPKFNMIELEEYTKRHKYNNYIRTHITYNKLTILVFQPSPPKTKDINLLSTKCFAHCSAINLL